MKKIKVIYVSEHTTGRTTYLYDKISKTLLPVDTGDSIDTHWVANLLDALFIVLKGNPLGIELYDYSDKQFCSRLILQNSFGTYCKVKLPIEYSLDLSLKNNLPVLIKDYLLAKQGIKITKELLKKSLATTEDTFEH